MKSLISFIFTLILSCHSTVYALEPNTVIVTPHIQVPNFAHQDQAGSRSIITSTRHGNWSDPTTWQPREPRTEDIVIVKHQVQFNSTAQIHSLALYRGGHLNFARNQNTSLSLVNLQVFTGGHLEVGSTAQPIVPTATATITFRDAPLPTGTLSNPSTDPEQWGNGLLVLGGKLTMHGSVKIPTFVRLSQEPSAGTKSLHLSTIPTGWHTGDLITLPDTRHLEKGESDWLGTYQPQWETRAVSNISGDVVTLNNPLQYNHLGARDGEHTLEFLPHIANLSRNIVVRSENPQGVRGHILFTYRSTIDVRFSQFKDLGRTTIDPLNSSAFDGNDVLTHIGTNQVGRYPLHAYHLYGPAAVPTNGHQFTLIGNVIDGGLGNPKSKWGIVISDSHYGLVKSNIVFNAGGAGIAVPTASSSYNIFEQNFVAAIRGNGLKIITNNIQKQPGSEGAAYWSLSPNNRFRNNVATSVGMTSGSSNVGHGWNSGYAVYSGGNADIPAFQGADPSSESESISVDMKALPLLEFADNEVYGAVKIGMITVFLGQNVATRDKVSVIRNFRAWNVHDVGYWGHWNNNVELNRLIVRGDKSRVGDRYHHRAIGVTFESNVNKDIRIIDMDIQGLKTGLRPPTAAQTRDVTEPGIVHIQGGYLRNYTNISVPTIALYNTGRGLAPRTTHISNVSFQTVDAQGTPHQGLPQYNIVMDYLVGSYANVVQRDVVYVTQYNSILGSDFQIYYLEQAADFMVPASQTNAVGFPTLVGSPEAGLTNEANWSKYGIAIAGAITPCTDTTSRPQIKGFVCPLVASDTLAPSAPSGIHAERK